MPKHLRLAKKNCAQQDETKLCNIFFLFRKYGNMEAMKFIAFNEIDWPSLKFYRPNYNKIIWVSNFEHLLLYSSNFYFINKLLNATILQIKSLLQLSLCFFLINRYHWFFIIFIFFFFFTSYYYIIILFFIYYYLLHIYFLPYLFFFSTLFTYLFICLLFIRTVL